MKKLLALVLALVMTMSLVTISNAAFSDADEIDYTEAVEVMNAVGVLAGMPDGSFAPQETLTRAQACKIIAYLDLGGKTADAIKGSGVVFTDVPADHWAAGYIEYCAGAGYVAGVGNGKFDPEAKVTGVQFAKMLLCALGYKAEIEGYTGTDYTIAIARDANKNDLFDGLSIVTSAALTREQAAQMAFNALGANVVEYKGGTNVSTSDGTTVVVKADRDEVSETKYCYDLDDPTDTVQQLTEKLYKGDLKKQSTYDAYGRPGTRWTYKNDKVGDYSDEAIAVYSAKVSKGELYDLLGKDALDDVATSTANNLKGTLAVFIDGAPTLYVGASDNLYAGVTSSKFDAAARAKFFVNNSSEAYAKTESNEAAKGVTTEVYKDDDGNITIVTIHYYVMKATADYNEKKDELQVSVKTGSASTSKLDGADFDVEGYKKNDYIMYTYVNGSVEDIIPATVVEGEVTAYSKTNSVTIAGTKYNYSKTIKTADKNTEYRVGDTASVVLDQFGYVVLVDDASVSVGNYAYVDGVAKKSGLGTEYIAKVYFTDGTKSEVTLDDVYLYQNTAGTTQTSLTKVDLATLKSTASGNAAVNIGTNSNTYLDGWYTYSKNSDGEYTLRAVASGAVATATGAVAGEKVTFATGLKGNANTVMIVDDGDDITVFTGIKNFPEISTTTLISALKEKADATKTYIGVVLVKTAASVDAKDSKTTMYVLDEDSNYVDSDDNQSYSVMNVILNGELTTVKCKTGDLTAYTLYTKVKEDTDGYFKGTQTFATKAGLDSKYKDITLSGSSSDTLGYSGASLTIGSDSYLVGDETVITLLLKPSAAGALTTDIMTDPAADYELTLNADADTLDSMFDGYKLTGTLNVVLDDTDSDLATSIVLTVTAATV